MSRRKREFLLFFAVAPGSLLWYSERVLCSGIEAGTFASAAGGGGSEQKGVAVVKIRRRRMPSNEFWEPQQDITGLPV